MLQYVAIDIETTGLNPETCQVLEIAAVAEVGDWTTPVEELPTFHCYVSHRRYTGQAFALAMNAHILDVLASPDKRAGHLVVRPEEVGLRFLDFINLHFPDDRRINAAGKNAASFDLPFLAKLPDWPANRFRHRVLDVGNLWVSPHDEKLPDLADCCDRAGFRNPGPAHDARADARAVVELVRRRFALNITQLADTITTTTTMADTGAL